MKSVGIYEIEFETEVMSAQSKNYPNSGFFIVSIENKPKELKFIDKKLAGTCSVCSELLLNNVIKYQEKNSVKEDRSISKEYLKVDTDFILEFSRVLLNRK